MQVLLADDNPINRRLAGLFLQQLGARVTQAENGHMAIEACRETRFDLILMDVHMPLIDGPEAAARIRSCSSQVNTDTPIVALTADIAENDRRRLLQQGLDAVETKPITQQALRHLLLAYQGRSEERNSVLLARTA
jgi:CheY-like chemotaxis protein